MTTGPRFPWHPLVGAALALGGLVWVGLTWVGAAAEAGRSPMAMTGAKDDAGEAVVPSLAPPVASPEASQPEKSRFAAVMMAGVLEKDRPLVLEPSSGFPTFQPGQTTKLFYTTQRKFVGKLTESEVVDVIDSGAADALELHLRDDLRERLRGELAEFDESLRDLAILIDEEETAVRLALREREDRCFHFSTLPIEVDDQFPRFRLIKPLPKEGTVWGDAPRHPSG